MESARVDYFTKEITISTEGVCVLDLFQHFAPFSTNKHEVWKVACHGAYIQGVKEKPPKLKTPTEAPHMEQQQLDKTETLMEHQLLKKGPGLERGMPLLINCSHSYYTYKNAHGETKKEYYPLALIPTESVAYATKGTTVDGNTYDFTSELIWVPFTPNGNDTTKIWLQYPSTRIHNIRQPKFMPFPTFMSKVFITLWLIFKKIH